jgi:hypothetical protein
LGQPARGYESWSGFTSMMKHLWHDSIFKTEMLPGERSHQRTSNKPSLGHRLARIPVLRHNGYRHEIITPKYIAFIGFVGDILGELDAIYISGAKTGTY